MRSPRRAFTLFLLSLALLPAPAAAQAPAEAYRAWWASGLTLADPGAERFRSRASLTELDAFRAEEPEMAAEAIAFMTEMHRDLVAAAVPGHIEVLHEDAEEAHLHVVLEGRGGALPSDMPSEARVRMVREDDGWKVDTESFSGASFGGGSGAAGAVAEACEAVLGDPGSPHRLVVHAAGGDQTLHFGSAYMLRDGDVLTLHMPAFDENLLIVEARAGGGEPGSHAAVLGGTLWGGGCPALPEALVQESEPAGRLEWQFLDAASARVSFAFADAASNALLLSGDLAAVPVLDVSPGPMGTGSVMVTMDEQEIVPDRGSVILHEGEGRLEITLEYVRPNGSGSTTIAVPEFRGQVGVYPGGTWFDTREVTVVRVFDGTRIELEVREVALDALPEGSLSADAVLGMGTLKARVVTDRLVVVPPLPPVGG
jgi:hypothetical protein